MAPADPPVYHARSLEDVLNAVPTLFGFVPTESIIGVAVSGPRNRFGFRLRVNIPIEREHDGQIAAVVAEHLRRNADDAVLLIALCADPAVGEDLLYAVEELLDATPVRLKIWATHDRLWTDLDGCPPEGEPYELSDVHEARLAAVAAGHVVAASREALYEEVAPRSDAHDPALLSSFTAVVTELDGAVEEGGEAAAVHHLTRLLAAAWRGAGLSDVELLRLGALVGDIELRDRAWAQIQQSNALQMHALWCAVARLMPESLAVPALCLAGFAAWLHGDGARASIALERAQELRPDYSLGGLLSSLVMSGMDPARWEEIERLQGGPGAAGGTRRTA